MLHVKKMAIATTIITSKKHHVISTINIMTMIHLILMAKTPPLPRKAPNRGPHLALLSDLHEAVVWVTVHDAHVRAGLGRDRPSDCMVCQL